jgi:chromosome partitioning protein
MTTTIAVLNQKGGVGKSMLSQNLAACAHLRGIKTLLLDMDEQATSRQWFAARAGSSKLRGLRVDVASERSLWTEERFTETIGGYELVVCDGPPRLAEVTRAAAFLADVVVVPMRPGVAEWWAGKANVEAFNVADQLRRLRGREPVRRTYVLNEVFQRVKETVIMADALREQEVELLPMMIAHRAAYERARAAGESVLSVDPRGVAAAEVSAVFDAIMQSMSAERPAAAEVA